MATTTLSYAALLLVASFHASLSWDASNIWFPDPNNPVFYNMTFYQQAAAATAAAQSAVDNAIPPVTDRPHRRDEELERPAPPPVFNRLPARSETWAPVSQTDLPPPPPPPRRTRPTTTTTTPRPKVNQQRTKKPNRNRQQPTPTSGRLWGAGDAVSHQPDISRVIAEQQTFIRNEQNRRQQQQQPSSVGGIDRLAAEQQLFIRNEQQNGQRLFSGNNVVTASSPPRRYPAQEQQRNVFVRGEERRPEYYPEVPVGYKTVPLEETTASTGSQTYYYDNNNNNDRRTQQQQQQQLAGNRLRRTKNDGIADGGDYFNNGRSNGGQFSSGEQQRQRWNANRDAIAGQTRPDRRTFATRPVQRAVDPVEGNRRLWNNAGSTTGNGDEENVISDQEGSSKPAGPSKCVWAIISCCKPSSSQIRYTCFETLGCHGAFWDTNPCSKEMTMAAVQATANFYNIPRTVE